MGVMGLTTFTNSAAGQKLLDSHLLHGGSLIIDGSSVAAQVYLATARARAPYGGDYNTLAHEYECFFKSLLDCGIKLYVLCDGGYLPRKIRTVIKRLTSRVRDAAKLVPLTYKEYNIFPFMLRDVLYDVLTKLKIDYVICEWEADHEIAALAKYLNAPVLSYDSDYYIYNVNYIPINCLELKPTKIDNGKLALKCDMYSPDNFNKAFGLESELLPLFGTLLGNDYVKRSMFTKFFKNISIDGKVSRTKKNLGQCRISSLIGWLRNESYESAITSILSRFKENRKYRILGAIEKSCLVYKNSKCKYLSDLNIKSKCDINDINDVNENICHEVDDLNIIDEVNSDSDSDSDSSSDAESDQESDVCILETQINGYKGNFPPWIVNLLKKGDISPRYYDLLCNKTYIGAPQIEEVNMADAQECSLPILRFNYDLITYFVNNCNITFMGRKQKKIIQKQVPRIENISWRMKQSLLQMDTQPSSDYFYYFLQKKIPEIFTENLHMVPENIQLLITTIIWLRAQRNLIPNFSENHVYSLIMCGLMLTIIDDRVGVKVSHKIFHRKYHTLLEVIQTSERSRIIKRKELIQKKVESNVNQPIDTRLADLENANIEFDDCMVTASVFLRYFEIDNNTTSKKCTYDRSIVHSFSQFQSCFQQLSYLNVITGHPLEPCSISTVFNGTFLYNLCVELRRRRDPRTYVLGLLKSAPTLRSYFETIADFVMAVEPKHENILMKHLPCKQFIVENVSYHRLPKCFSLLLGFLMIYYSMCNFHQLIFVQ